MDGFKSFYNEKNGKAILFFGFYIVFFIALSFYLRSLNANKPKETPKEEQEVQKITTYDITQLTNNDYNYTIEIIDDGEIINFQGKKSNVDYENYSNKYFLDIYNLNQLLKRSTFKDSENYVLTYELSNKEINDILLTNKESGYNTIEVYVNDKTEVNKISLDLSNYFGKEIYKITINYTIGEENENSSS